MELNIYEAKFVVYIISFSLLFVGSWNISLADINRQIGTTSTRLVVVI